MKRSWALSAIVLSTLSVSSLPAAGQRAKPVPSAQQPGAAKPASSTPVGRLGAGADDGGKKQGAPPALPPAQLAAENELPPGHPAVGPEDEEGAGTRRGIRMNAADPRTMSPPLDGAVDDATLPPGVVVVSIQDAQGKPLPGARVTLSASHSSVAKGDSREDLARETDAQGTARFEGLAGDTRTSYTVTTKRGQGTYSHGPLMLARASGKRVTLHAYETSANIEELPVALQALVAVTLREDSVQIQEFFVVMNLGTVAWTPNATFTLPAGFRAFNKQDPVDDARIEEIAGSGAALRGTYPPGRHEVGFQYQVPLTNEGQQKITIAMPPRIAQARVLAEASKSMSLEVAGFPAAQRTEGRDGRRLLMTDREARRPEEAVRTLEITLGGLPTTGPGRWIALLLAAIAASAGLLYGTRKGDGSLDEDARQDLEEAREALLEELMALERARKSGEIGPKAYDRVRTSLVDALGRLLGMLEMQPRTQKKTVAARG